MVKFANTVVGTGVEAWQAGYNYLGFARGNLGFVAMGDLGREFYTGLPDGRYCDIITDCAQEQKLMSCNTKLRSRLLIGCLLSSYSQSGALLDAALDYMTTTHKFLPPDGEDKRGQRLFRGQGHL